MILAWARHKTATVTWNMGTDDTSTLRYTVVTLRHNHWTE